MSQLQQSLSSERKAIEEERSKLLTQIQQEREALLKSKVSHSHAALRESFSKSLPVFYQFEKAYIVYTVLQL